jgi:hypothetical protein
MDNEKPRLTALAPQIRTSVNIAIIKIMVFVKTILPAYCQSWLNCGTKINFSSFLLV